MSESSRPASPSRRTSTHILTFERLLKAAAIGVGGLLALGLLIACIKAFRIQDTDSQALWFCVTLTVGIIVLGVYLGFSETKIRFAGLIFQIFGVCVAFYALQDVRNKLGQPGVMTAFADIAEKPFKSDSGATGDAQLAESASDTPTGIGTLTVHHNNLSAEDRFNVIEDQLAKVEAMAGRDAFLLKRAIQENKDDIENRGKAIKTLKELVIEIQTGGLPIALFGLVWLLIGAVLSSLPNELATGIKRLRIWRVRYGSARARSRKRATRRLTKRQASITAPIGADQRARQSANRTEEGTSK